MDEDNRSVWGKGGGAQILTEIKNCPKLHHYFRFKCYVLLCRIVIDWTPLRGPVIGEFSVGEREAICALYQVGGGSKYGSGITNTVTKL